ncbi:MAG: hypothetical protein D6771_03220, partial [Zetaproteobacteria bacterium]
MGRSSARCPNGVRRRWRARSCRGGGLRPICAGGMRRRSCWRGLRRWRRGEGGGMAEAMVVGAGAWGTALALVLGRSGHQVWLWARPETAAYVEQRRESPKLPGIALPESVRPTAEVRHAKQAALIVYALPCAALAQRMPALPLPSDAPVVVATKGIDPETGLRADELARRYAPESPIALLSGPSFAREVAEGKPTAIVLAAESLALAQQAAGFFSD